jgi:hypothetical protein
MQTLGVNAAVNYHIGSAIVASGTNVCAQKCTANPACLSMTYDSSTHVCQLNNVVLAQAQATAVVAANSVLWYDYTDY